MTEQNRKKAIQDKVLAQMRKTRAEIEKDHPQLFKALRMLVSQAHTDQTPEKKLQPKPAEEETVAIDRQKNLEAVIKYAALNPGSEKLRAQLKEFIN